MIRIQGIQPADPWATEKIYANLSLPYPPPSPSPFYLPLLSFLFHFFFLSSSLSLSSPLPSFLNLSSSAFAIPCRPFFSFLFPISFVSSLPIPFCIFYQLLSSLFLFLLSSFLFPNSLLPLPQSPSLRVTFSPLPPYPCSLHLLWLLFPSLYAFSSILFPPPSSLFRPSYSSSLSPFPLYLFLLSSFLFSLPPSTFPIPHVSSIFFLSILPVSLHNNFASPLPLTSEKKSLSFSSLHSAFAHSPLPDPIPYFQSLPFLSIFNLSLISSLHPFFHHEAFSISFCFFSALYCQLYCTYFQVWVHALWQFNLTIYSYQPFPPNKTPLVSLLFENFSPNK